MHVEQFEPIYLEPQGVARLTEYGKRWLSNRVEQVEKHWPVMLDILKLARAEQMKWPAMQAALAIEGVPVGISSGLSGYVMPKIIDYVNAKTTTAFSPTTVAMSMSTGTAPSVTTTGANGDNAGQYTGYTRLTLTNANWVASTGTNPCQSTYSSTGAVTFPACTAGTATETGFILADSATLNSGNALWYGTLASVVVSTTQTPPTLAQNALVVSLNGT